jgi:hypothetical protein
MLGKKGHTRSPDLKRVWIRSDEQFIMNLELASHKEGLDKATFLRKAADARITQVLFADNGDIDTLTGTEVNNE